MPRERIDDMADAYQRGRQEALEEAARVAEETGGYLVDIVEAIRALKDRQPMTISQDLHDMIAKLEAGDYTDANQLAHKITDALHGDLFSHEQGSAGWQAWQQTYHALAGALHGSLDAAMKLVPEVLLHLGEIDADGLPYACCGNPSNSTEGKGTGRTPAQALAVAALRARVALFSPHDPKMET